MFKLNDELTVEYQGFEDIGNGEIKVKYTLNGEPIDFSMEIEELEKMLAETIDSQSV